MADMQALLNGFLDLLMKAFPTSPFADTIEKFSKLPYLGYINWFVPVSEMVAIGSAWLLAIGVYYIYSIIARWVKLIEKSIRGNYYDIFVLRDSRIR